MENYNFKTPYFLGTLGLSLYLLITKTQFPENPILYGILGVLLFYVLLFLLIDYVTKKVIKVVLRSNTISLVYKFMNKSDELVWTINATQIQLIELKDHRSFFEGIQINFKNSADQSKLKLLDKDWDYSDFESIYTEFKNRKKEGIAVNEKPVFHQLQLMNNTLPPEHKI